MDSMFKDASHLAGPVMRERRHPKQQQQQQQQHYHLKHKSHKGGGYQAPKNTKPPPIQPPPCLVNSITEDEEDRQARYAPQPPLSQQAPDAFNMIYTPKASDVPSGASEAESFLRHYDTMMRQQEVEYESTLSHLRPMLRNLVVLARADDDNEQHRGSLTPYYKADDEDENCLLRDFTFEELKRAMQRLEFTPSSYKFMTADSQFMLTLRVLTEKIDLVNGSNSNAAEDRITWIEIMQCYRICVVGMQTLEKITEPRDIRARARGRVISMMSLFSSVVPLSSQDRPRESQDATTAVVPSVKDEAIMGHATMAPDRWEESRCFVSRSMTITLACFLGMMLIALVGHLPSNEAIGGNPSVIQELSLDRQNISSCDIPEQSTPSPSIDAHDTYSADTLQQDYDVTETVARPLPSTPFQQPTTMAPRRVPLYSLLEYSPQRKYLTTDSHPYYYQQQQQQMPSLKHTTLRSYPVMASGIPPANEAQRIDSSSESSSIDLSGPTGPRVASVVGTVTAGLLVPTLSTASLALPASVFPLLSIGGTVIAATLVAHGLRALIVRWYGTLRQRKVHHS